MSPTCNATVDHRSRLHVAVPRFGPRDTVEMVETHTLTCDVEQTSPITMLRLHGSLAAESVAVFRSVVLKCLTDEPRAIIADLSGVDQFDDIGLVVFPSVSRASGAWPGAELILHSASEQLARRAGDMAVLRQVPLVATREEALALARTGTGATEVHADLPDNATAVALARAVVREVCRRGGLTSVEPYAELVVTELVSNAVRHGRPPLRMAVRMRPHQLHLAVADASRDRPTLLGPDPETGEGGRGLVLVDALTLGWGATDTSTGKVVWATLRYTRADHRATGRPVRGRRRR